VNLEALRRSAEQEWQALNHPSRPQILIGQATCGEAAGAGAVRRSVLDTLARLGIAADVHSTGCLGTCYCEPLVDIIKPGAPRISYHSMTPEKVSSLLEDYLVKDNPCPDLALGVWGEARGGIPALLDHSMLKSQVRIALRNAGVIVPDNLLHYLARGGYKGLERALSMSPDAVIAEIEKSGLRGRGGAGFPTGAKWKLCRKSRSVPKYVICNADEGDPGAFMDRDLLESDPHAVLEGILVGAFAIGASHGVIYIRAEYPLAIRRLESAIADLHRHNLLGDNILGSGFDFNLSIVMGAGVFVCGEGTALTASIMGRRGMPRTRPPFSSEAGLWGKPTSINNVETWACVSAVMLNGAEWFASYGTEKSRGTKTFSLAGKVRRTGLIEVPMGMSLEQIIFGIGGGIPYDKKFKAVQTGGPAGGCIPAEKLHLPVDYEALKKAGSFMGSGGMIVLDEDNCIVETARYFLSFIVDESCGKCVPCRLGTRQLLDTLTCITRGSGTAADIDKVLGLGRSIIASSLCGLGQGAPQPCLTTIDYFRDEYDEHICDHICRAGECRALVAYAILKDRCGGCGICRRSCPSDAISGERGRAHVIDVDKCSKCGNCLEVCSVKFSAVARVPAGKG